MSRARSVFFWALFATFVVACLAWFFVVPYAPERLYTAIPAQATVVSAHFNLAGRWDDLRGNPVTASFLHTLGVERDEIETLSADPAFRKWLKKLASDEVIVAYVPSLGVTHDPTWIVASWVGGGSQRLRWLLSTQKNMKAAWRHHHPVWSIKPKGIKMRQRVRFTLAEGMAIAVISEDPVAMDEVLTCLDGHSPSLARREDLKFPRADTTDFDRGWFKTSSKGAGVYSADRMFYSFRSVTTGGIHGTLRLPYGLAGGASTGAPLDEVQRIWGSRPLAWISADRPVVVAWLTKLWRYPWAASVTDLVAREAQGPLAIGLFGGEFSGRFKGLKLPTLMAASAVTNGETSVAGVRERMDKLNATFRWGLVPREVSAGSRTVYAIESTARNPYSSLAPNEQISYTSGSNWLMFASNGEGLTNLLVAAETAPGPSTVLQAETPAPVVGWMNLKDGGKALRLAITAYSFKLGVLDSRGSHVERQRLNEAKAWIDALAPLGELRFTARGQGEETVIDFEAGNGVP